MANVTVTEANSAPDRKEFIELPYRLHKGHPYWVPPLRSDVAHLLDPKNPFFAHAEAQQFIARDSSGKVVGRIVAVKNDASEIATLIEIVAEDRPGLLYDLARAISDAGCNIEVVLIDTEAHKALDVFYVTRQGHKLDDAAQEGLRASLVEACSAAH